MTSASMGATNSRASLEPERTVVTLPEENPEIEPLAGASERQGGTLSFGCIAYSIVGLGYSSCGLRTRPGSIAPADAWQFDVTGGFVE